VQAFKGAGIFYKLSENIYSIKRNERMLTPGQRKTDPNESHNPVTVWG
jgi:hypothetical protein